MLTPMARMGNIQGYVRGLEGWFEWRDLPTTRWGEPKQCCGPGPERERKGRNTVGVGPAEMVESLYWVQVCAASW